MRKIRPIGWLVVGLPLVASGAGLVLSSSVEIGIPLAILGAGFLGFAAGLARSSAADRELIGDIEEELIKQRQQDLLEIQNRWHRDGVSPTEQTYRALVRPPRPMDGETATGEPLVLDETDRRLGKMIQERCDRVWEGIDVRRYVIRKGGQVAGLDGGVILAEIREIVRDVARLYSADTDNPVMEARIGDIALAARSVVSELLQAAQQVPFVDPTRLTIGQIVSQQSDPKAAVAAYSWLDTNSRCWVDDPNGRQQVDRHSQTGKNRSCYDLLWIYADQHSGHACRVRLYDRDGELLMDRYTEPHA